MPKICKLDKNSSCRTNQHNSKIKKMYDYNCDTPRLSSIDILGLRRKRLQEESRDAFEKQIEFLCVQSVIMLKSSNKWELSSVTSSSYSIYKVLAQKHANNSFLNAIIKSNPSRFLHELTKQQYKIGDVIELKLKSSKGSSRDLLI